MTGQLERCKCNMLQVILLASKSASSEGLRSV